MNILYYQLVYPIGIIAINYIDALLMPYMLVNSIYTHASEHHPVGFAIFRRYLDFSSTIT